MDLKERIVMTLITNLDNAYCRMCRNKDREICDNCAIGYKMTAWGISYEEAEKIADNIVNLLTCAGDKQ